MGLPPSTHGLFWSNSSRASPAGTGLRDKDERRAFGLQPSDQLIDVTLARPDVAEGDALGTVILGSIRHGKSIFVDIKTDVECARLCHG
jgi:hypothetical protein